MPEPPRRVRPGIAQTQLPRLLGAAFHANRRFSSKALLRQPVGFEGFGWFREEARVEHLAPPHPLNSRNGDVDLDAAPPPASPEPANSNNLLSGFSRLLDLEAHLFKVLRQFGHKSQQPVMAQIGLALQLSPQGN